MEILIQLRKSRNLTQNDVAIKLGISRQAYANYETGKREPDLQMLKKIANYFDVSVDYLLDNTNKIGGIIMLNRLETMRKVRGKTQQEVADHIGITQNAYSYWENNKVKIDHESLIKLASYYDVSLDFLLGVPYKITIPVSSWRQSYQEDYHRGDRHVKEYLEYKHGRPIFINEESQDDEKPADEGELTDEYSVTEKTLIEYFRNLDESERFKVIQYTMNLSSEAEKKPISKAT